MSFLYVFDYRKASMSHTINESSVMILIEKNIKGWIERKREPKYFYQDFADLLRAFDNIFNYQFYYFGYLVCFVNLIREADEYSGNSNSLIDYLQQWTFRQWQVEFGRYKDRYQYQLRQHRYHENKNRLEIRNRVLELTRQYRTLLVVRVDFAYLKQFLSHNTIQSFHDDLRTFRYEIGKNRNGLFNDLIFYAWAAEQGEEDKGYHCHALLIFNGAKRYDGKGIAKQVGELWQRLTHDQGTYFNCNSPAYLRSYEKQGKTGVGMIYSAVPVQVRNLLTVVEYMAQPEKAQYLRVKTSHGMRTFGMSQR